MLATKRLLLLIIVIIIAIAASIFFYPVKTSWSDEELLALGITNATCDANIRCQEGFECVSLPIEGKYLRCVPKDLDLCSTFCNKFRGCMLAMSLPPILDCK